MSLRCLSLTLPVVLALQGLMVAQAPAPRQRARTALKSVPQPPVPSDPLELVTGDAQPVQDAEQRQAAVSLLLTARALSNVRAQPYDLKTTFTSTGSSASDGSWILEDTSASAKAYRWTAQGPGYSATNLYTNKILYSNQPATTVPLRLAQVRTATFFMYPPFGPRASLRTAAGSLNGTELSCVLLKRGMVTKAEAGGRRWDESEYCIEPKSGLLTTYSPVPGLYVLYDYSGAFHFHSTVLPNKFTITQSGQTVIQARVESVADPGNGDPGLFEPSGLTKVGVGSLMTPPWHVSSMGPGPNPKGPVQVVVIHGMLSPQGILSETEILATTDAGMNQAAIAKASEWQSWRSTVDEDEAGVTPQSHEVFFTMQFGGSTISGSAGPG